MFSGGINPSSAVAWELRRDLARVGASLHARRFVVGGEGNLSARLSGNRFLVTPAGTCKGLLEPADLLEVDLEGRPAALAPGRPSSEWALHRVIYERCPEARAICHAHPAHATACATAHVELDHRLLTETALALGPVPLAGPAVPGTEEVAASVADLLPAARAVLLANHGVVAWGGDLDEAVHRLESVERLAEVTILAQAIGGPRPLDADFLARANGHQGKGSSPR